MTDPWLIAATSFALSQVLLGLALLPGLRPWSQQQWFYALFLVAVAAYLLDPLLDGGVADFVLGSLTVLVPGAFFLFSASLFDDHFALRPWHFYLVGVTVFFPLIGRLAHLAGATRWDILLFGLPQLLEFALLGLALFVAARHWRPDLVAERRRLRLWFSGFAGLYIFVLILFRQLVLIDQPALAGLQFLPACMILLATNGLLLRYRRGIWDRPGSAPGAEPAEPATLAPGAAETAEDAVDPGTLTALEQLMEEGVYREMGLTIADLARRAEIPAYRLRAAINSGLGYRNFNDFLNSYRIREAAARLRDPAQEEVQILVIALDAGFRSLSTFNKAFKAAFDCTPTDYRRSQLAVSGG